MTPAELSKAVEASMPLAETLFSELRERTRDTLGVSRDSYGKGEQTAHDLLAEAARALDLEVKIDHAGNLFMTLPGTDRGRPYVIAGSHLDSVPQGGNYDGAAGVIAAVCAIAALRHAGAQLLSDVTAMAIRGEESAWFPIHHIGSRAALGLLSVEEIDSRPRVDTGRTLAEHMTELGFDPDPLRQGERSIDPKKLRAYFEVHIEQGPVLVHERYPLGIVTAIRGNLRARDAKCLGEAAHSGATPRKLRRDSVMAMAEYVGKLETAWEEIESAGGDLVLTFGKLYTDPESHAHSRVPGEVRFTLDIRSHDQATLEDMREVITREAADVGSRRRLSIDLGALSNVNPAIMDNSLRSLLRAGTEELDLSAMDIPSGGGHDAGDFANAGVPTAMIFVRNPYGSHNPREHMEMADFADAVRLLTWTVFKAATD